MQYLSPSIVQIKDFCSEKNAIQERTNQNTPLNIFHLIGTL